MLRCDARGIHMSETMEFLDFGEIFRGAERSIISVRHGIVVVSHFSVDIMPV